MLDSLAELFDLTRLTGQHGLHNHTFVLESLYSGR